MPNSNSSRSAEAAKSDKRLTQVERTQVIAARPDMQGPKAAINGAAWEQVDRIMKQRKLQTSK